MSNPTVTPNENLEQLTGIVERVTFHNEQTGWSVLKVTSFRDPARMTTVLIHQVKVFAGATMEFWGAWGHHPTHGEQFKAVRAVEKKPATAAALEKYLGSGLIRGVGPATAILDRHGHAQQVVLLGQFNGLVVVAMLDVAQLFDGPQLATIGIDVGQKLGAGIGLHGGS